MSVFIYRLCHYRNYLLLCVNREGCLCCDKGGEEVMELVSNNMLMIYP